MPACVHVHMQTGIVCVMPARMQKAHLQNLIFCCMRKAMLVLRTRGIWKGDMFERRRRVAELENVCHI